MIFSVGSMASIICHDVSGISAQGGIGTIGLFHALLGRGALTGLGFQVVSIVYAMKSSWALRALRSSISMFTVVSGGIPLVHSLRKSRCSRGHLMEAGPSTWLWRSRSVCVEMQRCSGAVMGGGCTDGESDMVVEQLGATESESGVAGGVRGAYADRETVCVVLEHISGGTGFGVIGVVDTGWTGGVVDFAG